VENIYKKGDRAFNTGRRKIFLKIQICWLS
jgi:hypothetical protein